MKKNDRLVWLDMEMTGLDPETCVPLEVAIIITDNKFVELASYESLTKASEESLAKMNDFVRNMHTKNGLLGRLAQTEKSLQQVETEMLTVLSEHCDAKTGVLAGNSIHQDRRFLRRYFPRFEQALHYRMVDVSTVKELARRWYGRRALPQKENAHTAMADIRASIEELAHYKETLWHPPAKPAGD